MYRFEDNGKRKVALRYDQTVPLARFIAQNYQTITFPFKRYQIQSVWRAENTQKGRYREFLQCDVDTVGTDNPRADVEIVALVLDCYKALGFKKIKVVLNDRAIFSNLPAAAVLILDKLSKIGAEKVRQELKIKGFDEEILEQIKKQKPTPKVQSIIALAQKTGVDKNSLIFEPTLARGLDYYTSLILEVEVEGYDGGAIGGGGRYDNLIGMFAAKQIPAVGFSFGFDRTVEAMSEQKLFPSELSGSATKLLVTVFPEYEEKSINLVSKLRNAGISAELYLEAVKLEKQLRYADRKQIPYVVVIGPEEEKESVVTVKTLKTGKQEKLTEEQLINKLRS
jgi:histidyl-tRNA synthetase